MKKLTSTSLVLACVLMSPLVQAQDANPDPFNLGQVVVTGTRTEHTLGEAPVAVEVITREEIETRNIQRVQDALDHIPGLRITRTSSSWGNKGNVSIQGLSSSHTLILVDGQRYLGGHSGVDVQSIPLDMIDRIEVVKGPASALYGSDAMGGVINIITRKADTSTTRIEVSAGSNQTRNINVTGSLQRPGWSGSANLSHVTSDGRNKATDAHEETRLQVRGDIDISPSINLTVKPFISKSKMDEQGREQTRMGLNTQLDWIPNELSAVGLRVSWLDYQHETANRSTDWQDKETEIDLSWSRVLGTTHLITSGLQTKSSSRDDRGKNFDADQSIHSLYVQDEMDFDPLVIVVGGRLDKHDKWDFQFSPKLNLLYRLNDEIRLKASAGTAFKAPTLTDLYGDNWRMGPYIVRANPNLKPEESVGYQLGAEYRPSQKLTMELSLFRNELENLISSSINRRGPPPWQMTWVNIDKAMTQGAEFQLRSQFSRHTRLETGLTWMQTENKLTGNELERRPSLTASARLEHHVPSMKTRGSLEWQYVGSRYDDDDNLEELGGYSLLHLALSHQLTSHIEVFCRADNLTGQNDIIDEYDLNGRSYHVGLRAKF